jgi:prevent-host-death family protein
MPVVGSRALQRDTKEILDGIEEDGQPVVIARRGRPVAALIPIDQEEAERLVLAAAPQFVESRRRAEHAHQEGRTRPIEEIAQELGIEGDGEIERLAPIGEQRATSKLFGAGALPDPGSDAAEVVSQEAEELADWLAVEAETPEAAAEQLRHEVLVLSAATMKLLGSSDED